MMRGGGGVKGYPHATKTVDDWEVDGVQRVNGRWTTLPQVLDSLWLNLRRVGPRAV